MYNPLLNKDLARDILFQYLLLFMDILFIFVPHLYHTWYKD